MDAKKDACLLRRIALFNIRICLSCSLVSGVHSTKVCTGERVLQCSSQHVAQNVMW